jgi:hypothetical protein
VPAPARYRRRAAWPAVRRRLVHHFLAAPDLSGGGRPAADERAAALLGLDPNSPRRAAGLRHADLALNHTASREQTNLNGPGRAACAL